MATIYDNTLASSVLNYAQGPDYLNTLLPNCGLQTAAHDCTTYVYFALWTTQFPSISANCVERPSI